jgi:hypothetical protein
VHLIGSGGSAVLIGGRRFGIPDELRFRVGDGTPTNAASVSAAGVGNVLLAAGLPG